MCKYSYVIYSIVSGNRYHYASFSSCEGALCHAALCAKKYAASFELWKVPENPAFALCKGRIFRIDGNGIHPIF